MIVAVLYFAREVLIPLALAVLLSFILAPLVIRLQRLHLGRIPAVLITTVLSFSVLGAIGWLVTVQIIDLADQLPQYRSNILEKFESLQSASHGALSRATRGIEEISKDLQTAATRPDADDPAAAGEAAPPEPVPVRVVPPPRNPAEAIMAFVAPALNPLVSAGIVIVFVIFMLYQREDLRDRMIRLVGEGRLTVTTQVIDDAARRVSRYLLMQVIINATYGAAVMVGLIFIGVPNALLWGVLATLLRFIPYLGPWLGAMLPIALSLAVFDDWTRPMLTIGLFVVLELVSNNLMEPWLYGSGTGLTAMAVLLSILFWTWLWGPVGLVLATPLTVCLVVLGRHVPQMEFLAVLLSDQPSLPLDARIYQRLLASDVDEVVELADEYLKSGTIADFYDRELLGVLQMAERDRHRGVLEAGRDRAVYEGMRELIEELSERAAEARSDEPKAGPAQRTILMIPAHDEADELAAMMLAQLLRTAGARADVISAHTLGAERLAIVEERRPVAVCISAVPPTAVTHARYHCKLVRSRFPQLKIVVGIWTTPSLTEARQRIASCGTSTVVSTLGQAIQEVTTADERAAAA